MNPLVKSSLVLAFLGDAIYELYIRKYLINKGLEDVDSLQKEATKYVSARNQALLLDWLINNNYFSQDEVRIIKRGRNTKSHSSKSAGIIAYKKSTGLEALLGFLYLNNDVKRIEEIINKIIEVKEIC